MALIKCCECGKEISDKANACIHCGCPISEILIYKESPEVKNYEYIKNKLKENNYFKAKTILDCHRELQMPQEEIKLIVETILQEYEKEKQEQEMLDKVNRAALLDAQFKVDKAKYEAKYGPIIECPICGCVSVKKISVVGKIVSTELLGLASGTIGKTFKCQRCGHKW